MTVSEGGSVLVEGLTIAIPTYRRPDAVVCAVRGALAQAAAAAGAAGVSGDAAEVVVIDNDPSASARSAVSALRADAPEGVGLRYVVESRPGVAAVRNRALDEATGRLLLFIDDDEEPESGWLAALLATFADTRPAAVAGLVVPVYDSEPDAWVRAGAFFERRTWPTGTLRPVAATNNLLLDLRFVRDHGLRFDEAFGATGGEERSGGATAPACAITCRSPVWGGSGFSDVSAPMRRPRCASISPWPDRGCMSPDARGRWAAALCGCCSARRAPASGCSADL